MTSAGDLFRMARTMAVDGFTVEAMSALAAAGVDALLLKGPAVAAWLYGPGDARFYSDTDLLVERRRVADAERVLADLGYTLRDPEGEVNQLVSGPHAQTWTRHADGATVDLHHTLPGEVSADEVLWPVLWRRSRRLDLAGVPVPVLDPAALALMVALHAGHHGPEWGGPMEDLRRALAQPDTLWMEAAAVADQVMALPQFAAGLRLQEQGAALAQRLGLPAAAVLEAAGNDGMASGFARLAATRGRRRRAALIAREVFPTVSFMHWWRPWSRGSRARLSLAYAYRVGWLLVHALPGLLAWRRIRAR